MTNYSNKSREELIREIKGLKETFERIRIEKSPLENNIENYTRHSIDGVAICELVIDKSQIELDVIHIEPSPNAQAETRKKIETILNKTSASTDKSGQQQSPVEIYKEVLDSGKPVRFRYHYPSDNCTIEHEVFSLGQGMVAITFTDISYSVLAEKRFRESEEKFRAYVEKSPTALFITNEKGEYRFVNPAACILTGYSQEELLSMTINDVTHPDDRRKGCSVFKKLINEGEIKVDIKLHKKNGTEIDVILDAVRLNKNNYMGFHTDITERKLMEEQLRQSEKLQAIGQLAGGIAHDFNNQLSSIVGYAEILKEEISDNKTLVNYVDNILTATKRSSDLTLQLLAFARKGKYRSISIDIHQIIVEVISLLKHSLDKKIEIKQTLAADPAIFTGDPTLLQNAFLNLALNARDAMPDGGELIFSTCNVELDRENCEMLCRRILPGLYIQISVSDSGVGMTEKIRKRIFEPFFTTKGPGEGTGMGLAAVHGTIKTHNGTITVESEEKQGTTFTVYLPVKDKKQGKSPGKSPGKSSSKSSGKSSDKKPPKPYYKGDAHILFVDDEEMICEMAHIMLSRLGYSVTICRNGEEAVKEYARSWREIDLVILDVTMPRMNGEEAYYKMREINPKIVVLLASGYSLDGQAEKILKSGVKDFIHKPFDLAELSEKLTKLLMVAD